MEEPEEQTEEEEPEMEEPTEMGGLMGRRE